MKHSLKVSVSKEPQTAGVVTCRSVTVREKLLRLLFGDRQHLTIIIPGDSVRELAICETEKGGETDE